MDITKLSKTNVSLLSSGRKGIFIFAKESNVKGNLINEAINLVGNKGTYRRKCRRSII